jgi:prepilin-type N-terminal cleavage/methylation domain-containing protein
MSRLADDDGFTLPELIIAMAVGMLVLLAAFQTLDTTMLTTGRVQRRVDSAQRARTAMDDVVRQLRSQVCLTNEFGTVTAVSPPIKVVGTGPMTVVPSGNGTQTVAFYTDLQRTAAYKSSTPKPPELHVLTYDGAAFRVREDAYVPTVTGSGATLTVTYPASPSRTRVLATDVHRVATTAVFRFFQNNAAAVPPEANKEVFPWTADADKVSKLTVAFDVWPSGVKSPKGLDTVLTEDVFVREVDPYDTSRAPKC